MSASAGALSNDFDADADPLTAAKLTDPSKGTVDFSSDGSFTYTPDDDATGNDTFTYRVSDGTDDSNIATITIEITPVNDVPVALACGAVSYTHLTLPTKA